MKLLQTLSATTALTLCATGALALNGTVGLTYTAAPDDTYVYQIDAGGSFMYDISPTWRLQFDLDVQKYQDTSEVYYDYGIHAIYALNPSTDIGAFVAQDRGGFSDWTYLGAEVGYTGSAMDLEAFATYETDYAGHSGYMLGALVGYSFDNLGSLPGQLRVYGGYTTDTGAHYVYAGLTSDITDNMELDLRFGNVNDGSSFRYISLGLNYNFGSGARFAPRAYTPSFPGY